MSDDPAADFFAREENELGDLGQELGFNNTVNHSNEPSGDLSYHQPTITVTLPEPESVRIWRREFRERIETKDREESSKRSELEQSSAQQICDWRRHYAEQMEKTWNLNREHDKHFKAQREEMLKRNQSVDLLEANKVAARCATWEQVCLLCDFSAPKPKSASAASNKDVSRMRSLLLQLKQQPLVR